MTEDIIFKVLMGADTPLVLFVLWWMGVIKKPGTRSDPALSEGERQMLNEMHSSMVENNQLIAQLATGMQALQVQATTTTEILRGLLDEMREIRRTK